MAEKKSAVAVIVADHLNKTRTIQLHFHYILLRAQVSGRVEPFSHNLHHKERLKNPVFEELMHYSYSAENSAPRYCLISWCKLYELPSRAPLDPFALENRLLSWCRLYEFLLKPPLCEPLLFGKRTVSLMKII